jgi:two-component system sensor histidine kinase KdpD
MSRGRFKLFLGYAAGVGKTYQMLVEARRLRDHGRDTVVGYFEPHARKDTIAQSEGLELVPRTVYEHRGIPLEEMDAEAVIARGPQVAAIDEFAHTNVPGSPRLKRWQDVMAILDAGIVVLTSLNVQHIESLNDQVWHVTGIRVKETVPDWAVQEADEIVMVDVTPRALLHRLERGAVYAPDKAQRAIENFFTESNLTALRELALRQTAQQLEGRREEEEYKPVLAGASPGEHIMLWITPDPAAAVLIRRGRRVADYLGGRCTAVYLERNEEMLGSYLNYCRNLRIEVTCVSGDDVARALAEHAQRHAATQVLVTRRAPEFNKLVRLMRDMQVTIVGERVRPDRR